MKIHKMSAQDIVACAKILKENYENPPYNEKFQEDYHIKYIQTKFNKNVETCFIMIEEEKIIGFCVVSLNYWTHGLQAILEDINISPTFQ